jgi:flagellar L-ring protein precursor FlgH
MFRSLDVSRIAAVSLFLPLAACSSIDRLKNIGEKPQLSPIELPATPPPVQPHVAGKRLVTKDSGVVYQASLAHNASLWRSGSRAFFKDQRAAQVGDLLTVRVRITDSAKFDNSSQRSRSGAENMGAEGFFGAEQQLSKILADGVKPDALVGLKSGSSSTGAGTVKRQEQLVTDIAATVSQVMPNGNLIIEGKQEVRVNYEVRELTVTGVVRPEDIEAGNTIESTKIAQARISYGGRGQISDVQQPRYGQQVLDVVLPW